MLALFLLSSTAYGQLSPSFYDKSCPAAERIVGDYVRLHVRRVPTVAPALLRTHYHDCFVQVTKLFKPLSQHIYSCRLICMQ